MNLAVISTIKEVLSAESNDISLRMTGEFDFFNSLTLPFIQRSLLTAIFLGILCAIIGVFVILREMVFLVDGIAHSAFAGGALSILLGINPLITIGGFGLITALSMAYINEKGKLQNETAIGIVFAFTMALAIIFRSMFTQYTNGIDALLFGSIATVSLNEFLIIIVMTISILIIIVFIQKELFFTTINEELSKANGLNVRKYSYLFLIIVSIIIMVSIRSVGVILLLALIVTPGASAYQLTYNFNKMLVYSLAISISGSFIGYMIAYIFDFAANAVIVCVLTFFFILTFIFSPKRRHFKSFINDEYCETCEKILQDNVACQYCKEGDHNHNLIEKKEEDSINSHKNIKLDLKNNK
jgi:ABC-type Mn2+/Zn2+ transport system permease subunit